MTPTLWFICPHFGNRSEVWMYRQATSIQRFGVHVICRGHLNPDEYPAAGVTVSVMPEGASAPGSRIAKVVASVRNAHRGFFDGSAQERRWLHELRDRQEPDVILCQFGLVAARLVPLLRSWGKPIVVHFHGNDLSGVLRSRYYRWRIKSAVRHCSGIVVVADYMRDWLLRNGASPESIRKIPCGVPLGDFAFDRGRPGKNCRFLAVGRFVEKKRPDLTIRAFAHCTDACDRVELTMIGDGPMLEYCRRLALELDISHRVRFLGEAPISVVRGELCRGDVFVQHSVTSKNGDMEGWPVAIAEAAASGMPVIATNHASIPEQIEHGRGGLLVDELDWRAMGDCMRELAEDLERRRSMGIEAFRRISAFDSNCQIRELEEFLCSRMA